MVVMRCEEDTGTNLGNAVQIRRFAPPLVLLYSGDGRLLLVTDDRLFTLWVMFPFQIGVVARVLLIGFVFL